MRRVIRFFVGVVTLGLALGSAVAALAISEENGFPIFGIGVGQTARLNVINTISDPGVMPCRVALSFFDGEGNLLGGPDTKELRPGQSAFLDQAITDPGIRPPGRLQIRAAVAAEFGNGQELRACGRVIQTLEVFSTETGQTVFIHPMVIRGFNPQPDPPGKAGAQ